MSATVTPLANAAVARAMAEGSAVDYSRAMVALLGRALLRGGRGLVTAGNWDRMSRDHLVGHMARAVEALRDAPQDPGAIAGALATIGANALDALAALDRAGKLTIPAGAVGGPPAVTPTTTPTGITPPGPAGAA